MLSEYFPDVNPFTPLSKHGKQELLVIATIPTQSSFKKKIIEYPKIIEFSGGKAKHRSSLHLKLRPLMWEPDRHTNITSHRAGNREGLVLCVHQGSVAGWSSISHAEEKPAPRNYRDCSFKVSRSQML
jgi:hypothetical protein